MIVATIRVRTSAENHRELLQTFRSLSGSIQNERGCKSCRVYLEIGYEQTVILIEEWESRRDWVDHLRSDDFAVIMGAMSLVKEDKTVEFKLLNQMESSESIQAMRARNLEGIGDCDEFTATPPQKPGRITSVRSS